MTRRLRIYSRANTGIRTSAYCQSDHHGVERDRLDLRSTPWGYIRFKVELVDIKIDKLLLYQRVAGPRFQDGARIRLEVAETIEIRAALL